MSPKPLVDHRIYTIKLRKMAEFLDVFDRLAMPVLLQVPRAAARLLREPRRTAQSVRASLGL